MKTLTPTPEDVARFRSKAAPNGECLEWQDSTKGQGYGRFGMRVDGRRVMAQAHRVAYTIAYGAIPSDMLIDHICRNRACVNPEHLRPVTSKQNRENLGGARPSNKSGVRGVIWDKSRDKWQGIVGHNGKRYHVGRYDRVEDAATAVIAKRMELHTHNELDRRGV